MPDSLWGHMQGTTQFTAIAPIGITQFVERLRALPESLFDDVERITEFMRNNPVEPASLERYITWNSQHYTRNLVDHTEIYDLIAICWEPGQRSSVHNHQGQKCWMATPIGRLIGQNYRVISDCEAGCCELEATVRFEMNAANPVAVNPAEPVHEVVNPKEFGQRVVSLHIYSRPFDRCLVYSAETHTCGEVQLRYDSVCGKPAE